MVKLIDCISGTTIRMRQGWRGENPDFGRGSDTDGRVSAILVRGEPMRAKFRDSWERPTALTPGKMVDLNSADAGPSITRFWRGTPDLWCSWEFAGSRWRT